MCSDQPDVFTNEREKIDSSSRRDMQVKVKQMFRYGKNEVYVVTTRFSEQTWSLNKGWRERRGKLGCLYGQPRAPSAVVPDNAVMMVIEMNNDALPSDREEGQIAPRGRVEGLGLCINKPLPVKLAVYGQRRYDRIIYAGRYRVDRSQMDSALRQHLDAICFRGNCHMKRGIGFTSLPDGWLGRDLAGALRSAFRGAHKRFLTQQLGSRRVEAVSRA